MIINEREVKVLGYCSLHYGVEYLSASLQSYMDYCDKVVILYTPQGSQGSTSTIPCPETKEELFEICKRTLGDKLIWNEGCYHTEGEHRDTILKFADGYSLIVTADSDEIWHSDDLPLALKLAYETDKRHIGISGFHHFWKSFSHRCHDQFLPERIINLHNAFGTHGTIDARIYHFGYAQSDRIIKYKFLTSGHKNELRPDFMDKYFNWKEGDTDVHPTSYGLWTPTFFDKTILPDILRNHSNYSKETIS